MANTKYVPQLLQLFRDYGYDGATLTKISKATGLGKASLYHHFPGGKDGMVEAVLDYLDQAIQKHILKPLQSEGDTQTRFRKMCDEIGEMFEGGRQPCVFAVLLMGSSRDVFHDKVKILLQNWIKAIADVLIVEGVDKSRAMELGEDAVLAIEGALILSQGLNDFTSFRRVLSRLPEELCQDLE